MLVVTMHVRTPDRQQESRNFAIIIISDEPSTSLSLSECCMFGGEGAMCARGIPA